MTSTTSLTVEFHVAVPPATVMAALSDLQRLPEWSPMHRNVEIIAHNADGRPERIRVDAKVAFFTDPEVLRYDWQGLERVSWTLERSTYLHAQEGLFVLTPVDGGTDVAFTTAIEAKFQAPSFLVRAVQQATSSAVGRRFAAFAEAYRP